MLSEEKQQALWEMIFFAEARAAYYGDSASRHHRYQRHLSTAILFVSSGSVVAFAIRDSATLAPSIHPWAPITIAIAAALLSAVNFTAQFSKIANESSELCTKWANLATDAEELWSDMYSASAGTTLLALQRKSNDYGRAGHSLPFSKKRWDEWQANMRKLFDSRLTANPSSL